MSTLKDQLTESTNMEKSLGSSENEKVYGFQKTELLTESLVPEKGEILPLDEEEEWD